MAIIQWTPGLSVGIEEIDIQHQNIVRLINELHDNITIDNSIIGRVITELIDYTKVHFLTEEKYFQKFHYPKTVEHISEHNKLIKTVHNFKEKYDSGETISISEMLMFLSSWLRDHIITSDKAYSSFLKERKPE